MPTRNPARAQLVEAVRTEISRSFDEVGFCRARPVAEVVISDHADLIEELGAQLAMDSVHRMVTRELKSWAALNSMSGAQLNLPGIDGEDLKILHPTITVPEGDDVKHITLDRCTVAEFRSYEAMLTEQVAADQRRLSVVRAISYRVRLAGEDETLRGALASVEEPVQ